MATVKAEREKIKRVDVRQAAKSAIEYFQLLFPEASDFSLEEVELSEDEKYWLITLGFEVAKTKNPISLYKDSLQGLLNPPKTKYKLFKVDVRTGEVQGMKIRSLE